MIAAEPLSLLTEATGGGRPPVATGRLTPLLPVSFVLAGALTGATVAQAPPSSLDWTSAQVRALVHARPWEPQHTPVTPPAAGAAGVLLERVKQDSGLTWNHLADALSVDVRAVHLWRNGGGISAGREARLHELAFVVASVALDTPAEARAELIDARAGRSLLERLAAGASGNEAALAAPWRTEAREGLRRSTEAVRSGEPIDEDFLFLLYVDPAGIDALIAGLGDTLEEPVTLRRAWEEHLDAQFDQVEQPAVDAAPVLLDEDEDAPALAPLFNIDDLGITLGVGAIASRPTLGG